MASAVPLVDESPRSARREASRWADDLTGHLAELLADLDARSDPSEISQLHESARLAVGTVIRLLVAAAAVPTVPRTSTGPAELDAWIQLLDELLTNARAAGAIARPRESREAQCRRLDEIVDELREAVAETFPSPRGTQHGEVPR
jgi:hypothetical protein